MAESKDGGSGITVWKVAPVLVVVLGALLFGLGYEPREAAMWAGGAGLACVLAPFMVIGAVVLVFGVVIAGAAVLDLWDKVVKG